MKAQVISFNCILRDPLGKVISSSFNHDVLAQPRGTKDRETQLAGLSAAHHFDFHEPLQGLVEGLQGIKKGERRKIFVTAERAYGFYDPTLVMQVSRKKLPHGESLEIGFQVFTQAKDGECRIFRVTEADGTSVTLDGNHPLAGQDLCFDIETTSTREATPEEIQGKRVEGPVAAPQIH
jgi:FKBP-type peptidyl-prolyl cis-trans isomerase SlyD